MYKNWRAICQIKDVHFMWALALLDLTSDFGRMVAERLPEYFSSEQQMGPIPLSVLRLIAKRNCPSKCGCEEYCDSAEDLLVLHEAIPGDWPVFNFGDENTVNAYGDSYGFKQIPSELKGACEVGSIHEWKGKRLVLVETACVEGEEWVFVPAELIIIDK